MAKKINPSEAKILGDNYDTKHNTLSKLIKKEDNRSSSLSLTELKEYIKYLETEGENIDGIRIYFGSYKNESGPGGKSDNDLTTVFFVPTRKDEDDVNLKVLNYFDPRIPPKKYTGQ